MAAENDPSKIPPVQFIRLVNSAWMNCIMRIHYDFDESTKNFKSSKEIIELCKDCSWSFDLSTLENIKPRAVIRLSVRSAREPGPVDNILYNPNRQTATYQFNGTLFSCSLDKIS